MSTEFVETPRREIKLSKGHAEVLARMGIKSEDITEVMDTKRGEARYILSSGQTEVKGKQFSFERQCAIHEIGKAVQVWVTDIVTEAQKSWAVSMALFYRKEGLLAKKLNLDKMRIYGQLEQVDVGWDQDADVMIEVNGATGRVTGLRLDRDAARLLSLVLTKGDEERFPGPYFEQTKKKDDLIGNFYYVPSRYEEGAKERILSCLSTNFGSPVGVYSRLGGLEAMEGVVKRFANSPTPFEYKSAMVHKGDKTIETVALFPKF